MRPNTVRVNGIGFQRIDVIVIEEKEKIVFRKTSAVGVCGKRLTQIIEDHIRDHPILHIKTDQYDRVYSINKVSHYMSGFGPVMALDAEHLPNGTHTASQIEWLECIKQMPYMGLEL